MATLKINETNYTYVNRKIEKYFRECEEKKEPLTITGLALSLNVTTATLRKYEAKWSRDDATSTQRNLLNLLKRSEEKIKNSVEKRLFTQYSTGAIFWLKNNAGYKDKTETDVTSGGQSIAPASLQAPKEAGSDAQTLQSLPLNEFLKRTQKSKESQAEGEKTQK